MSSAPTSGPQEIERLLVQAEALPDAAARATARALVGAVLDFHRVALERLLGQLAPEPERLARAIGDDEVVRGLLALHDLLPPETPAGLVPLERLRATPRQKSGEQRAHDGHDERCDLCASPVAGEHAHLLETANRTLHCVCAACALLLPAGAGGRYRPIPRRLARLPGFRLDEATWGTLGIPVGLAFLWRRSGAEGAVACYPGPAGAVEAQVDAGAWEALVAVNPVLGELAADVEALLVHRLRGQPEHYRVSIDECYRLVGLVRRHWRGMNGGAQVQGAIEGFFATMREQAT